MPSPSSSGSRTEDLVLNMQNSYENILHDDSHIYVFFFVMKLVILLNIHTEGWISLTYGHSQECYVVFMLMASVTDE